MHHKIPLHSGSPRQSGSRTFGNSSYRYQHSLLSTRRTKNHRSLLRCSPRSGLTLIIAFSLFATFVLFWRRNPPSPVLPWSPLRGITVKKPHHRHHHHSDDHISSTLQRKPQPIVIKDVSTRPAFASKRFEGEKFLSYLPHSGFHNQRIALENALSLAKLLDRTLIVPPVWLGLNIPYIESNKLLERVQLTSSRIGWQRCTQLEEDDILPPECIGYSDWTSFGWGYLVDLPAVEQNQPLVERWNFTNTWLEETLGISDSDTFAFPDGGSIYKHRIYDSPDDDNSLASFKERIDLSYLKSLNTYKHLSFSSLFATRRLRFTVPETWEARTNARKHMIFREPRLQAAALQIQKLLGGSTNYAALHLRIGNSFFSESATENIRAIFVELCVNQLGVQQGHVEEFLKVFDSNSKRPKKRTSTIIASDEGAPAEELNQQVKLEKRAQNPLFLKPPDRHSELAPFPLIRNIESTPLSPTLKCRSPLHLVEALLPLNIPLYIATDSAAPLQDPFIKPFLAAFPCTFFLSDFSQLAEMKVLDGLRNKEDGVMLKGFLMPFMDAMVASMGRTIIGTPQSTFSSFTVDVLHQVAHGWEIIQRGA